MSTVRMNIHVSDQLFWSRKKQFCFREIFLFLFFQLVSLIVFKKQLKNIEISNKYFHQINNLVSSLKRKTNYD